MKNEKQKMNNCEKVQLLIEDHLDGMIRAEDKRLMEEHISSCNECKSYLEYTVMLIDNASLISRGDKLPGVKKSELWANIEAKINARSVQESSQIYNMSGLEDEYIPVQKKEESYPGSRWSSLRYYVSGLAAVFALAFIIYMVSQFRQGSEINIVSDGSIFETATKWRITTIKGTPMIDNVLMKNVDSIAVGQYIITDDSSRAELTAANLGTVIIEPNSRVKFTKSAGGEHRIELVYGSIDADIIAKPRSFFVDAGKVSAVDLGCSYKISMDRSGDGLLYVKSGRVSLETAGGRESIVPEGKFCVLKKDVGPGTPFRGDTSPKLKQALMDFDFGECGSQCVNVILKNSKKTDAVTLINIIPRVDKEYKTLVYNKVSDYCTPPKNLPKDSIPRCDKIEKLNEWVDKVMEEVHKNIEENMKAIEKMKHFDHEKWSKSWDFRYTPLDTNVNFKFDFEAPSPEEMEELKKELNEMQLELRFDNEEFKKEMEELKREMERVGEDIKKENIERKKEQEEMLKEMQEKHKTKEEKLKQKQKEHEEKMKEKQKEKELNETPGNEQNNNGGTKEDKDVIEKK